MRIPLRRRFAAVLLPRYCLGLKPQVTRVPPVGFELATNSIQLYAMANLDKTSFYTEVYARVDFCSGFLRE